MTIGTPRSSTAGRVIGIALLVVGVVGVIVAIVGIIAGIQVVNGVGAAAQNVLSMTTNSLTTAKTTAEQAKVGIQQVQGGLDVVETTIVNTGNTVSQSDATLTAVLKRSARTCPTRSTAYRPLFHLRLKQPSLCWATSKPAWKAPARRSSKTARW